MERAVVSIALATLRDLLLEEAKFLHGVSSEVKALQTQLKEIQCLLEDADRRQHESKSVVNWISEIKDLAHRSENAIEIYAFRVSSKRRSGFKHLLRLFSCALTDGYSLHRTGSEISKIRSEIARVSKSMQEYGLRSIIQGESCIIDGNCNWRRQTFPYEIEDCFVGKDEELEQLLSLIVDDEAHRVVSIWGMGGIGKTTIARKVYNHATTQRAFDSFAWICLTQKCQIRSVLEDILKQLIPHKNDDISSLSNTELIGQLCQIQKGKKCMIVVDDVWEIDHWDGLKHAFIIQGLKSKILLTTRKQNVANVGFAFELGLLNVEDGWELLKKKAFLHRSIPDFAIEEKMLERMGKEMVCKCGYLPLVICLLGGILNTRKSMEEWESVNENISTYLYRGEGIDKENEILGVLNLSYVDLPYYLKPCFLYMGQQFREEKITSAKYLCMLWIAEGMISHENRGNETLMDIAELYLHELASRCIIQVEIEDAIRGEKFRSCKLHDVVLELCLSKGIMENFHFQDLDYQGGKFSTVFTESLSSVKPRSLVVHFERETELQLVQDELKITQLEDNGKHIRYLQLANHNNGKKIVFPHNVIDFQKYKLLRVLIFVGFTFSGGKLPRGINNLIHLRYLCLRQCELDELPSSISNLACLYTLDLSCSLNIRVPNVLKEMSRLKHLFLPFYDTRKFENCRLRLEGLDELETLYGFSSLVHELKSITRMKNLQRLAAIICDNESLSDIIHAITTIWKNLRDCAIIIDHSCQFILVDEGLMNLKKLFSCPNILDLSINVQLGNLLQDCGDTFITSRLRGLSLIGCKIDDDPMEILGKLPFLEKLDLLKRSFVGEKMTCHALGFPRLKTLGLDGLSHLREWKVEQGAMPVLSKIKISYCSQLEMVPNGLEFIVSLQSLTISRMAKLGERVSEGGEDFEKVCHVPSIIIVD